MRLTYGVPPLCMACKHLGVDTDPDAEAPDDVTPMSASCAAFPKGIPSEIFVSSGDHYEPIGGEVVVGGKPIVFELDPGEEYVMTWMGLILADTTLFDDETLVRAFKQLIEHLEGHIDTFSTPA